MFEYKKARFLKWKVLVILIDRGRTQVLLQYLTIKDYGEHEIVIQKSRFICYISRATTEEEAQEFIQKIKKTTLECNT